MIDTCDPQIVGQVLDRHRDEIVRRFNATGSGVGKRDPADDTHVIVVYLRSADDIPADPVFIEGIPVKFVVTGEIRPHPQK
jgi:hypothetical protein